MEVQDLQDLIAAEKEIKERQKQFAAKLREAGYVPLILINNFNEDEAWWLHQSKYEKYDEENRLRGEGYLYLSSLLATGYAFNVTDIGGIELTDND